MRRRGTRKRRRETEHDAAERTPRNAVAESHQQPPGATQHPMTDALLKPIRELKYLSTDQPESRRPYYRVVMRYPGR
jgi:hypothetical protein